MVDAENEEADAVSCGFAILAGQAGGSELVSAEDVFGAEVAGAEAIGAAEDFGNVADLKRGQAFRSGTAFVMGGLGEGGADVAAERVVAGKGFVGALEDDDVLLALEGFNDGGFGKGADDIDVKGADAGAVLLAQEIDSSLDVFSR